MSYRCDVVLKMIRSHIYVARMYVCFCNLHIKFTHLNVRMRSNAPPSSQSKVIALVLAAAKTRRCDFGHVCRRLWRALFKASNASQKASSYTQEKGVHCHTQKESSESNLHNSAQHLKASMSRNEAGHPAGNSACCAHRHLLFFCTSESDDHSQRLQMLLMCQYTNWGAS